MTNKEKMLNQELYIFKGDLLEENRKARETCFAFNSKPSPCMEIIKDLFGHIGNNCFIQTGFRCDYGSNIYIGDNFFANYNFVVLDVAKVTIGDYVFIGPDVGIYAAGHPIDSEVRDETLEFGKQITIGNSVWIGGHVSILPGVTIGSNVVIGAGSVVTKDIPSNVIAAGNPCHILREITAEDSKYWKERRAHYYETIEKDKEANK